MKCKIIKKKWRRRIQIWEIRDKKSIDSIDTKTVESAEFLDLGFSEIPRKPSTGRDQRCQKRKESKVERTKASTHSDRRAQREGTGKNDKNAQDNSFLKERFLLSKEKKTNLRVRDREKGERRQGMLKFRVRRKCVIYTCFKGRGRLCEL